MHLIDRPRGRIAYDLYGAGNSGALVVCVPGMFDHRSTFRFLGEDLAEAGFRVAAMDLRGHGDSDATFDDYDDPAAGSDILALVGKLGGPAVLVGNSMGAAAAVWAAAHRPGAVRGLVLMGAFLRDGEAGPLKAAVQRAALLRPWGPVLLPVLLDRLHTGRKPAGHREHLARVRAMLRPAERYRAVRRTLQTSHAQVEALLGDVDVPTLVLMGELDPDWPDPREEGRWITERLGGALMVLPECGHYPQAQRPDLVSPAVAEFAAKAVTGA